MIPTIDEKKSPALKPRDLGRPFAIPDIDSMRVLIGAQIVQCYIIPNLKRDVCYLSEMLAEHIKATHGPILHGPGMLDVWAPMPKREITTAPEPDLLKTRNYRRGERTYPKNPSGLSTMTPACERKTRSEQSRRYRERKKAEAQDARQLPENDHPLCPAPETFPGLETLEDAPDGPK